MKFLKSIVPLVVFICSGLKGNTQVVDSMMGVLANQYPQQKVYVHFDKSVYRPGETIWFKAYLFAGFEPSNFSKNFFAELIDQNGTVLQRKVCPIVEASAAGNFDLLPTQNNNVFFRAYTSWMLNSDTAFIFKRNITVVSSEPNKFKQVPEVLVTQLKLFPESGDLVNEVESVVAFMATNNKGKPVKVTGDIKNSTGETITSFKAQHDGMGTFLLLPKPNETYTAFYTDEFGKQGSVALPAAKANGVVLQINSSGNKKVFIVKRGALADGLETVNIVAHMAQQIVYKAKVPLKETIVNSGAIPASALPTGILQVTVFSDRWEPLAERIVFVNNDNYKFEASLTTPITNLGKRGKNIFEINVEDTLLANMSISITDAEIGRTSTEDNIISGLLLSGDIKGIIYNPTYYFANNADSTVNNLDLVMLTHGWRRFNWQNITRPRKPFIKYPADQPLSLIAKVFGVNPSSPIRPDETMTVILQTKDSTTQVISVPKTGPTEFALRNFVFYDTLKLYYQFDKDKKLASNTSLLFENGLYKGPRVISLPEYTIGNIDSLIINRAKYFADQIYKFGDGTKVNVLQEVIVKTKTRSKIDELDKKYASGLFSGGDAVTFDFVNDPQSSSFPNIFTYLQGRVAGLQITNNGSNVSLLWRGSATTTFLNEMQVDANTLSTISVADIAYVKVFRPPFFGAFGGGSGGAIAIYTRKGGDQPINPGKGLDRSFITGYSVMKQFYSPDYSNTQDEITSDLRSTLYWNPFVFTDATKTKVKIEFYNNDISKAMRVVIEGVNEYGKLIRIEKVVQ